MNRIHMLILGMMVATYLPRLLPFLLIGNKKIPVKIEEFLSHIPHAALGALIIHGFATATPGHFTSSLTGILLALAIGFYKGGVVFPVIGAILASMVLISIGI